MNGILARKYVLVWLSLLTLLGLSAGSAYIDLAWGNTAVNFAIALIKLALIMVVFMRALQGEGALRLAFGAAVFILTLLAFLSFGDYFTRELHPAPWREPQGAAANTPALV